MFQVLLIVCLPLLLHYQIIVSCFSKLCATLYCYLFPLIVSESKVFESKVVSAVVGVAVLIVIIPVVIVLIAFIINKKKKTCKLETHTALCLLNSTAVMVMSCENENRKTGNEYISTQLVSK